MGEDGDRGFGATAGPKALTRELQLRETLAGDDGLAATGLHYVADHGSWNLGTLFFRIPGRPAERSRRCARSADPSRGGGLGQAMDRKRGSPHANMKHPRSRGAGS